MTALAPTLISRDVHARRLVTRSSIASTLAQAGIRHGDVVCAHVGLSRLGYVPGAAQAVIEAMLDAVGPAGTIMMPSFSGELSDPAEWRAPPVPADWIEPIRAETPAYDAVRTPTRQMGVVAELFRHWPNARRSPHPHSSFAACGLRARDLVDRHPLDYRFGPGSPLGKLAALDGKVILLGAGVERASSVYLAQCLTGIGADITKSAPMIVDGTRRWVSYRDFAVANRLVSTGVEFLLREGIARTFPAGDSQVIVFAVREATSALVAWAWQGAGVETTVVRRPISIPEDWRQWLD